VDSDDETRARRYSRSRETLFLVSITLGWAMQAALLLSGRTNALARWAEALGGRRTWLGAGVFVVLFSLLTSVLSLPMDFLRGFIVEHAYKLSNQSRRAWATDQAKGIALGLAFEVPATLTTLALIRRYPRSWWVMLAGIMTPFSVLLSHLYPVLLAPMFNRFSPLADQALSDRVRSLASRADVQVARVDVVDMSAQTKKINAYFAGLGATRRIVLGDTLVAECSADEIEVIVAHELGHQVHSDIWKGIALGSLGVLAGAALVASVAPTLALRSARHLGFDRIDDVAAMPLLGLIASVVSVLSLPVINAFSRNVMERQADAYALRLTDNPAAFISAMEKLHRLNLTDPDPPAIVKYLLYSHPTAVERIAAARAYQETTA
jgi:STE24 endopeptidase